MGDKTNTITNDGKYMALTIGGSSTANAANWELLDIANQTLELINPTKTGGNNCGTNASDSPTSNPSCYWQSYRKDGFATETAWNPDSTIMVNMYMSKLYQSTVAISGTSACRRRRPARVTRTTTRAAAYRSAHRACSG